MDWKKKVIELEKRIEALEKRPAKRQAMQEVADWILKKFETKDVYTTRRLFDLALKECGWKYQTLQIARRHLLDDKIGIEHKKDKGWCWINLGDQ